MVVDETSRASHPLAAHDRAIRVAERLLLTGPSRPAWPDVAREGQVEAFRDACHAVNVLPLSLPAEGQGSAFVVGGDDKHLQMGEGNACLRRPPGSTLWPAPYLSDGQLDEAIASLHEAARALPRGDA